MAPAVIYNQFPVETIRFTKPEKRSGKIVTYAYRNVNDSAVPVIFQTPRMDVLLKDRSLICTGPSAFLDFMKHLEQYIIESVAANGPFFFAGKSYSKDKIQHSLLTSIDLESGTVQFRTKSNTLVTDQFGKQLRLDNQNNTKAEGVLLVQFEGLHFTRSSIEPVLSVVNAKVYTFANPKDFSFIPEEDDVTYRPDDDLASKIPEIQDEETPVIEERLLDALSSPTSVAQPGEPEKQEAGTEIADPAPADVAPSGSKIILVGSNSVQNE